MTMLFLERRRPVPSTTRMPLGVCGGGAVRDAAEAISPRVRQIHPTLVRATKSVDSPSTPR